MKWELQAASTYIAQLAAVSQNLPGVPCESLAGRTSGCPPGNPAKDYQAAWLAARLVTLLTAW